jgi:hypothetical protein
MPQAMPSSCIAYLLIEQTPQIFFRQDTRHGLDWRDLGRNLGGSPSFNRFDFVFALSADRAGGFSPEADAVARHHQGNRQPDGAKEATPFAAVITRIGQN